MIASLAELNNARAAGGGFVNTTGGLGLRAAPSLADGTPILALMPDGAAFRLTGEHRIGFVEGTFDGRTGWAFSEFLAAPGVTAVDHEVATVMSPEGLNLRAQPSLKASVLTLMPNGASLTLTGESRIGFVQGVFSGQAGWAVSEFVDPTSNGNDLKLVFEDAMRTANMQITQGPRNKFSHAQCDCYDFSVNVGTPIHSLAAGEVVRSEATNEVYRPNVVVVRTKFGDLLYAHLSQRNVRVGDRVERDTLLGLSGSENGGHLHLGLKGGFSPLGLSLTQILAKVGFKLRSFPVRPGVNIPD
jgi:uncharacterized protein YraI